MRFATSLAVAVLVHASSAFGEDLRERLLREHALAAGLIDVEELRPTVDAAKSKVGGLLFESEALSLNGDISCRSCHLDEFGTADGLPVAVGVRGVGKHVERLESGGSIVPRNTFALWGRGAPGFNRFFWDGKVDASPERAVKSQFGIHAPSKDPLVLLVHLPVVEFREMVAKDPETLAEFQKEDVNAASKIYDELARRMKSDVEIGPSLAEAFGVDTSEITFLEIAEAIAHFIRDEFAVPDTEFHRFVFGNGNLSKEAVDGGIVFYGKGRCSACHNGPFFSDFGFHAIPQLQVSFGANGFGVDYGRFNVSHDPRDLYKFRTPPLLDVSRTGPYGHSGVTGSLNEMVRAHFDPLYNFDGSELSLVDRVEFYKRITAWSASEVRPPILSDEDVGNLVAFLETLEVTRLVDHARR